MHGAPHHASGGETSALSHVYFVGIGAPSAKAVLVRMNVIMRPEGVEPPRVAPRDPKSRASASSATAAWWSGFNLRATTPAQQASTARLPGPRPLPTPA